MEKSRIDIGKILFKSIDHYRFENGIKVSGPHGGAPRGIKIVHDIRKQNSYLVTIHNHENSASLWGDNITMSEKQMEIISENENKIVLRGWGEDPMAFGHPSGKFSNYGITIFHSNNEIDKIILHMHDRNVDIEYFQEFKEPKKVEKKASGKYRILSPIEYQQFFTFKHPDSGSGVMYEDVTNDKYFTIDTYLPKDMLFTKSLKKFFPQLLFPLRDKLINLNFELFGTGSYNGFKTYVFKPWVIDYNYHQYMTELEKFILHIPDFYFAQIAKFCIQKWNVTWRDCENIRVLEDLSEEYVLNKKATSELENKLIESINSGLNEFTIDAIYKNRFSKYL